MTVFLSYAILLVVSNLLFVLGLRYFGLAFILDQAYRMFDKSCFSAILITLVLLALICTIAYFICRPFDVTLKKIKRDGYEPTPEELVQCLGCYKKLNVITIIANFIGFFLGQALMQFNGVRSGLYGFDIVRIIVILSQSIMFGGLCGISVINGLDKLLSPYREQLHLRSIEQYHKQRSMKISISIILTVMICLLFMGINMYALMYGSTLHTDKAAFLKKGIVCFVVSFLFCGYSVIVVINALIKRIKLTVEAMQDISYKGDLSKRIDITMLDDFGTLTTAINSTMETLSTMIKELSEKTSLVSDSANVITDSAVSASSALQQMTQTLSKINENSSNQNELIIEADKSIQELTNSVENVKKHVSEQAASVENISSSISEMTANISSVTETAKKAQITSDKLTESSVSGRQSVENAIATMNAIHESSEAVKEIIEVIQTIAEQTNLLSMNAAIEAAHAGQFGQGFAVVADEVRVLAESSSQSAADIQKHINDMTEKITLGVEAINSAGTSFKEIAERVEENGELVNTIFSAMQEQSMGAEETQNSTIQVVNAVQAVDKLTNEETIAAQKLSDFMSVVVSASNSTMEAVAESISATDNLKESINQVDKSALSNKQSVIVIKKQVDHFKL